MFPIAKIWTMRKFARSARHNAKDGRLERSFCCECLQRLTIRKAQATHADGTPICRARKPVDHHGPEIDVKGFDALLRTRIEASGKDPADNDNWEIIPAADGNKGGRKWKG